MTLPYTRLVSHILFPLHERLKSHQSVQRKVELEHSQWLSAEALHALTQQRLQAFLTDVNKVNPYFSGLFKSRGLEPSDFSDPEILSRIPYLDKERIRANQQSMLSQNIKPPQFMTTSGSSGQPLKFAVGKERISHDIAAKWRATRWWDVDIGDPEAVIWGSGIELNGQGIAKRVRDRMMRSQLFPAKQLKSHELLDLYHRLIAYRPAMIYGYPSILTLLAETARAHGLNNNNNNSSELKVIFCTAEKLYDPQRQLIEEVFNAPVANGYGSRDAGFIAHECPHGNLHISAEDVIVEILDDQQKPLAIGEQGEIVVTHLSTRAFPMIRYRTGDIGRLSAGRCPCGRGLPILAEVIGRANDLLKATDGASVHGAFIGNIVREDPAVGQFQFIQNTPTSFELKVVCRDNLLPDRNRLQAALCKVLGREAQIQINAVAAIEAEETGKFKYIINRCQLNH
ncbi:MAG: AMP-binding protein [Motiliproteus sp.]